MAQLTNEQLAFLKVQKISPSWLFDGSGLSKRARDEAMDALEKYFYYGGAPCAKEGHTLRTKAGHCIQCDTSKIAYQLRNSAAGYVYLAYSKSTKLCKVGFSKHHPQDRKDFLNKEAYGNITDWDIKKIIALKKDAGKKEFEIHSTLEMYQKAITYEKARGLIVECREIFSCDYQVALEAFHLHTA
jgi:hypothetical protein